MLAGISRKRSARYRLPADPVSALSPHHHHPLSPVSSLDFGRRVTGRDAGTGISRTRSLLGQNYDALPVSPASSVSAGRLHLC